MAGHSKWANIKHRKGRQDARRSKIWSKCSRAIIVAAKMGTPDPETNLTLRYAIDEAKSENMPKDTIEKAIAKGSGKQDGVNYESIIYEGYGAAGVAVLLDCLTDNKNRTVPEVRKIFEKFGGNLGASGCVAYNFKSKGQLYIAKADADEEAVMNTALEAGAEDFQDADDSWEILCEPTDYIAVRTALEEAGFAIESASVTMIPETTIECTGKDARKIFNLIEALDDHDDVQKVHANFDISDEEMEALQADM
jgi:YebC/PmpR family DNA-binding regulatory protein